TTQMATGFSPAPRKEGTWTKLVIFISLYFLILESMLQAVIVLFLYGRHQVDSNMTLSVVLSLVAAFITIPLVSLQSLVAWQYNKIGGFGEQKTVLHNVCTYVFRLDLMMWLAASVSGLVLAAHQVYCLPSGTDATFWKVGESCIFHRISVLVSVVSLATVCTIYCARELCDRPYDVSLIGIYKRSEALRDGSVFSGHSWDSDETLKNEILNLCRQHDGMAHEETWYMDPLANKVNCHPSIRHPAPVRLRPQLKLNTNHGSQYGDITSGVSISPDDTNSRYSPGAQTLASDFFPISRTSTLVNSHTANSTRALIADQSIPYVPQIPKAYGVNHKRQKSSLSSLKRFLPKVLPFSLPQSLELSSDPQIRALVDPNAASDVEKQVVTPDIKDPFVSSEDTTKESLSPYDATGQSNVQGHTRTLTMNSADAPEVVVQAEPKVRRSQTAYSSALSIHHPHHPNYVPAPNPRRYSQSCRQNSAFQPTQTDQTRRANTTRQANTSTPQYPTRSSSYQFKQSQMPCHTQSQHNLQYYQQSVPWNSQHLFDQSLPRPGPPVPRRNDVELVYPSTRRPRSNTHGGKSSTLSCIFETTPVPPLPVNGSLDMSNSEAQRNVIDQSMYRGANRTSKSFY
ncbi:hypothetical protein N7495_006271, partial [Penicillium taxi]|uniref:uncharacterized protein n=1 Tax=Penicillium taxi TaxID=168475 RepID=UPI002545A9E8